MHGQDAVGRARVAAILDSGTRLDERGLRADLGQIIRRPIPPYALTGPAYDKGRWRLGNLDLVQRRRLLLGAILIVAFVFYFWTGTTEGNPVHFGHQTDDYNQLANAFEHGRISLAARPPAGLLRLSDPYNPVLNAAYQKGFHDLALYRGHFYLTWGPTPVVTLLLPWRLLGIGDMPVNLGVVIYCWFGLVFSVALLCLVVRRYFPATKLWQLALATIALALSNVAPFLLRRPDVYELAISSGYCFAMLGLYLLAKGGLAQDREYGRVRPPSRLRPWLVGAGSLCVGLAAGGRPDLIFAGLFPVALLVFVVHRDRVRDWRRRIRVGAIVVGPFAVIALLLFAYNQARFGSPLNNGTGYVLAGYDPTKYPTLQLSYIVPNLVYYTVYPVRWTLAFPYFTLGPPPITNVLAPSDYYGSELAGGVLATTPILFALVPGAIYLWRSRQREIAGIVFTVVAAGALVLLFVCLALFGTTMRYQVDFAPFFLLPALVCWFALSRGRWRRAVAVVGALAVVYGAVAGAAFSMYGYYDQLRLEDPATYWSLVRITSPFPTALTALDGHPSISRVVLPGIAGFGNDGTYQISTTDFGISAVPVEVDIISPRSGSWAIAPTFRRIPALVKPVNLIVRANGYTVVVRMTARPRGFVIPLHRGLNRIDLKAVAGRVPTGELIVDATGIRILAQE